MKFNKIAIVLATVAGAIEFSISPANASLQSRVNQARAYTAIGVTTDDAREKVGAQGVESLSQIVREMDDEFFSTIDMGARANCKLIVDGRIKAAEGVADIYYRLKGAIDRSSATPEVKEMTRQLFLSAATAGILSNCERDNQGYWRMID